MLETNIISCFQLRKLKKLCDTMYIGEKPYFCSACGQKFVPTISPLRPLPARQFSQRSIRVSIVLAGWGGSNATRSPLSIFDEDISILYCIRFHFYRKLRAVCCPLTAQKMEGTRSLNFVNIISLTRTMLEWVFWSRYLCFWNKVFKNLWNIDV